VASALVDCVNSDGGQSFMNDVLEALGRTTVTPAMEAGLTNHVLVAHIGSVQLTCSTKLLPKIASTFYIVLH
jgi:hypothetical protein